MPPWCTASSAVEKPGSTAGRQASSPNTLRFTVPGMRLPAATVSPPLAAKASTKRALSVDSAQCVLQAGVSWPV
ncbi:hypothetical protein D3C72_2435960 [compost metagenome]